jgi:DNA-binding response OmpR family regulator
MKKKTVLIVEDSPGFSELMKFVVEDEGFKGVLFPLEEDFMRWVEKEKPSAIIMDLALNRMSGFDLIHELKAHAKHKSIPIIVITGRDLSVKDITDLKLMGVSYLRKGRVDMHEIHQAIKDALK